MFLPANNHHNVVVLVCVVGANDLMHEISRRLQQTVLGVDESSLSFNPSPITQRILAYRAYFGVRPGEWYPVNIREVHVASVPTIQRPGPRRFEIGSLPVVQNSTAKARGHPAAQSMPFHCASQTRPECSLILCCERARQNGHHGLAEPPSPSVGESERRHLRGISL